VALFFNDRIRQSLLAHLRWSSGAFQILEPKEGLQIARLVAEMIAAALVF
jgi:hypothetical protein